MLKVVVEFLTVANDAPMDNLLVFFSRSPIQHCSSCNDIYFAVIASRRITEGLQIRIRLTSHYYIVIEFNPKKMTKNFAVENDDCGGCVFKTSWQVLVVKMSTLTVSVTGIMFIWHF